MGNKNSFIMYADAIEYTEGMTDAQLGQLYRAQLQYANGIEPEITDDEVKGLWRIIKHQMNVNSDKYESKCEKLRANASKRKQTQAIATKSKQIVSDTDTDNDTEKKDTPDGVSKETATKHKCGRYRHVLLTEDESTKLVTDYGAEQAKEAIDYLDEYIERKGYKAKSHYLAIRKWVFDAIKEEKLKQQELAQREKRVNGIPPDKPKDGIKRKTDLDAWLKERVREQNDTKGKREEQVHAEGTEA